MNPKPVPAVESHPYRNYDRFDMGCPCGQRLATVERILQTVDFEYFKYPEDQETDDLGYRLQSPSHDTEDVVVGHRATLEAGFVNARGPHPSGRPWYVRGRPDRRPRVLPVRLPIVVTCSCGQEVGLDPDWERRVARRGRLAAGDLAADLADEREYDTKLRREPVE